VCVCVYAFFSFFFSVVDNSRLLPSFSFFLLITHSRSLCDTATAATQNMGTGISKTNLEVDDLFECPMPDLVEDSKFVLKVMLESQTDLDFYVILHARKMNGGDGDDDGKIRTTLRIATEWNEDKEKKKVDCTWTPKTHMRDFEVLMPNKEGEREIKIARGQGIGVVICEPMHACIKLRYDSEKKSGVLPDFMQWDHSSRAKDALHADLSLGYNVFYIRKKKTMTALGVDGDPVHVISDLVEKLDKRDRRKTKIFFKSLERYKSFNPVTRNPDSDEDDNEDDNDGKSDSDNDDDKDKDKDKDDDDKEESPPTKRARMDDNHDTAPVAATATVDASATITTTSTMNSDKE